MQTCENCGANFEQPKTLTEVTSLRILCPTCTAARQAAKARRNNAVHAADATASAPRVAPPTRAPQRAPAPVPAKPVPAKPVPAKPVQRAVPKSAPPPEVSNARPRASPKPASASASRPPSQRIPASASPERKASPKTARPTADKDNGAAMSERLKKKSSREVVIASVIAFLVLIAAGGVLWKVLGTKRAEAAAEQARLDTIEAFRSEFMGFDIATEDGASRLIAFTEEKRAIWEPTTLASDVVGRTAKAKTFLEGLAERRTLTERLDAVEASLAKGAELPPGDLAELRRRLEEISTKADIVGAEFVARVVKDREDVDRIYVQRLTESAEEAARSEPLDRTALSTIQQAEDEILKIYEVAYRAWQGNPQDSVLVEKKNDLQTTYQGLIKLSDEAVERFFKPDVIEAMPWTDLLASDHASGWIGASVPGFEHRIENGVMHMVGPSPEAGGEGIISIGDKEQWRDFLLDVELTIVSGQVTIFFRLPIVWQENVENFTLSSIADDGGTFDPGVSYNVAYSLIGSTLTDEVVSEDSLGPATNQVSWTKVRKGAIGLSIPKNTEVKFSRLRIKILR